MIVTVTNAFIEGSTRRENGAIADVDPSIAKRWIDNGWAVAGAQASSGGSSSGGSGVIGPVVADIIMFGDSIFAYGSQSGTLNSLNIPMWAFSTIGVPLEVSNNVAVGGKTVAEILSQQVPAVAASSAPVAWMHGFTNDMGNTNATAQGIAGAEVSFRSILTALSAKALVIVDSLNPVTVSAGAGSSNLQAELFNRMIQRVCAEFPNAFFNDTWTAMQDPASATGSPLASHTFDGVHQTAWGAKKLGFQSAKNMASRIKWTPKYSVVQAMSMPVLAATDAATTIPTNIGITAIAGSPTIAVVQRKNTAGLTRLSLNLTATTASDIVRMVNSNTTAYNANFSVGDKIRMWVQYTVESQSNVVRLALNGTLNGSINLNPADRYSFDNDTNPNYPTEAYAKKIYTPAFTITTAVTSVQLMLDIGWKAAGSAYITVSDWGIEKVA